MPCPNRHIIICVSSYLSRVLFSRLLTIVLTKLLDFLGPCYPHQLMSLKAHTTHPPTHPPTHPENIIALRIKESNKDVEELIDSQLINKLEQWRGVMGFGLTIIFSLYLFCFQLEEKEWSQHVDGYSLVGHCTTFHSIPWVVFCTFTITFLHTFIVPCWQVSTRSGVETVYSARACLCFFFSALVSHTKWN